MSDIDKLIFAPAEKLKAQGLKTSITGALDTNPDQAAEAATLAKDFNVPPETALRNREQLAREKTVSTMDYQNIATTSPKVADYLLDPMNAKISHDDITNLQNMEVRIGTKWSDYPRAGGAGAVKGTGSTLTGLGRFFESASSVEGMTISPGMQLSGRLLQMTGAPIKQFGEDIDVPESRRSFGTDVSGALGQLVPQVAVALTTGPVGSYTMLAGQGLDAGYESADRNGATGAKADLTALLYAGSTAAAEKYGLDAVMKGIPPAIRQRVSGEILEIAARVGVDPNQFFGKILEKAANATYAAGVEGLSEATEGFLQNVTDRLLLDENKDIFDGLGYQAQVGGAAGFGANLFLGMLTKGKARMDTEDFQGAADNNAENLKADIEAVRAPMTAQRSPERIESLVRDIAGDETIYFNGPAMAALFQSIDPNERAALNARLDDLEEKIALAANTGSDVAMTRAEFMANVAPLPIADKMVDLVKQRPDQISKVETSDPDVVAGIERGFEIEAIPAATPDELQKQAELSRRIAEDIAATGRYRRGDARKVAQLAAQFYMNTFEDGPAMYENHVRWSATGVPNQGTAEGIRDFLRTWKSGASFNVNNPRSVQTLLKLPAPPKSVLQYIGDLGGINLGLTRLELASLQENNKQKGRGTSKMALASGEIQSAFDGIRGGGRYLKTDGGLGLDDLYRSLADAGYIQDADAAGNEDVDAVIDLIRREANGERIYPVDIQLRIEETRGAFDENLNEYFKMGLSEQSSVEDILKIIGDGTRKADQAPAREEAEFESDIPFYQGIDTDYRGFITPEGAANYLVALTQRANKSTVLHEMGHLFLYQIRDGAIKGNLKNPRVWTDAVDYFSKNADMVVKEAAKRGKTITADDVAYLIDNDMTPLNDGALAAYEAVQELFARNFEQYLRSGKTAAPSLRRLMQTFKEWLTAIYRTAGQLDAALDPELVDIFDRMLATEDQVLAAKGELSLRGLSMFEGEEGFAEYQQQLKDAEEAAKEDLLTQYLDNLDNENSPEWEDHEKVMREDVAKDVLSEPVYRTIDDLVNGTLKDDAGNPIKLSKKAIEKAYGLPMLGVLNRHAKGNKGVYSVKNGHDLDLVADILGFDSADALIRTMATAQPMAARIEELTQSRMREKYGEPDPTVETAKEAIRNDKRALALGTELEWIGKQLGRQEKALAVHDAQVAARNIIGRRKVREAISPATFLAAERRSANAAFTAADKGDWESAYGHKKKQIANYYLWQAAKDAEKFEAKVFRKLKFLRKKNEDLKNVIDGDYADLMRMMAAKIGLRGGDFDAGTALQKFKMMDSVDQLDAQNALDFIEGTAPDDYLDMTYDDFRAAFDAMMNVNALGRARREVIINGERVEIQGFRSEISEEFQRLLGNKASMLDYNNTASKMQTAKAEMLEGYAWLRRVEYWVSAIEGNNLKGPLHRIFGMVKAGALNYREAERETNRRVHELLKPVEDAFAGPKVVAPELGGFTFDNVGHILGMMYHLGNPSNRAKLIGGRDEKLTGKPSWTEDGIQAFINRMAAEGRLEKRHMDHVQGVWNLLNEKLPEAQAAHKAMYGFRFNEVTAQKLMTPWGEYAGGYFPARTDKMLVEDAAIRAAEEDLTMNNNSFMFPSTGRGFTKGRDENYTQTLDMNPSNTLDHLQAVNRFVHLQPAIRTAGRVFNDRELRAEIAKVDPHVVSKTLIPWLQRAARQQAYGPSEAPGKLNSLARHLRTRSSAATMFLNISNTLQQITQLAPAALVLGPVNLARGSVTYLKNPLTNTRNIRKMSTEVAQRHLFFEEKASPLAQDILNGLVFTEENGYIKNGLIAVEKAGQFGDRYSYVMQTAFQVPIDNAVWLTAFNKALAGKVKDLGQFPTDDDARLYADKVLRETQISNAPEDVARFEAQGPWARLFTLYAGWFNGMLNLNNSIVSRLVRENGVKAIAPIAYAVFMAKVVPYVGGQIIADYLRGALPDDDDDDGWIIDDWATYSLFAFGRGVAAEIPFAGQVATYALGLAQKELGIGGYTSQNISVSPVLSAVERAARAPFSAYNAMVNDGDESKAWRDGLTMFQLFTGVPTAGQVARSAGYLADVKEGGTPEPQNTGELVKGLVGGTPY